MMIAIIAGVSVAIGVDLIVSYVVRPDESFYRFMTALVCAVAGIAGGYKICFFLYRGNRRKTVLVAFAFALAAAGSLLFVAQGGGELYATSDKSWTTYLYKALSWAVINVYYVALYLIVGAVVYKFHFKNTKQREESA